MKVLFREVDLYKGIILGCLVLLPVAGFFAWSLRKQIDEGNRSIAAATRANGTLEKIGVLQKQLENLVSNRQRTDQVQNHREYFENQLFRTKGSPLSQADFTIAPVNSIPIKQSYVDHEVTISFGRKEGGGRAEPLALPRDYVYAMLFNCESQSPVPGVWKLRKLLMKNAEAQDYLRSFKTPPPELKDDWVVDRLTFVRRGPVMAGR